jgi:hypothetical protein
VVAGYPARRGILTEVDLEFLGRQIGLLIEGQR